MSTIPEAEYQPPWLDRLNEESPKQAQRFTEDPRLTTKLDQLLAGVATVEDKYAIVRMAFEMGLDPNDSVFMMFITATKIQRLFHLDMDGFAARLNATIDRADETIRSIEQSVLEAPQLTATLTRATNDEIRSTSKLAIKAIQKTSDSINAAHTKQREELSTVVSEAKESLGVIQKALDDFPKFTAQFQTELSENIKTQAAAAVNEHARTFVIGKIELETREGIGNINKTMDGIASELRSCRESIAPLRAVVERAKADERVLVFGQSMRNREWVSLWAGSIGGLVVGALLMAALASFLHLGFDPQTLADVRAGRVYEAVFPMLSASCRDEIAGDVNGSRLHAAPR